MTPVNIAIASCEGRSRVTTLCLTSIAKQLPSIELVTPPTVFYATRNGAEPTSSVFRFVTLDKRISFNPAFRWMIRNVDHSTDLLWFEDDIYLGKGALTAMADLVIPPHVGIVSFFDFRNEFPKPGIFAHPRDRPLWGTQALRIRRELLPQLVASHIPMHGWDVFMGAVCQTRGYTIAQYSPSLVQHLGVRGKSVVAPGSQKPISRTFVGKVPA